MVMNATGSGRPEATPAPGVVEGGWWAKALAGVGPLPAVNCRSTLVSSAAVPVGASLNDDGSCARARGGPGDPWEVRGRRGDE